MSKHLAPLLVGAILVGLGVVLVAASIVELPSSSKSSPNRFYTAEEAAQYHTDRQRSQEMMALMWGGEGLQGSTEPPDDVMQELGEIGSRLAAAQEKQAAAHQSQRRLSRTLNGLGVAALAAGCVLLLLARRTRKAADIPQAAP